MSIQVDGVPAFTGPQQAAAVLQAAAGYLAAADPTALPAEAQAECLLGLERASAMTTAAHAVFLAGFTAARGCQGDGAYSPRSWLVHRARLTRAAANARVTWAGWATAHPRVFALLAAGDITEPYARAICTWTGTLPAEGRDAADGILAGAAAAGVDLPGLAGLFAGIREAARSPGPEDGKLADRGVRLETTFGGAGVICGDLTPECAAMVAAVLDALSGPAGAEDDRSHAERYHDALADAMGRLLASGLVPDRAGQPAKAWAHVSLAGLLAMEGSSALLARWAETVAGQWAAARAAACAAGGGDGAAWLDGPAAAAFTCDAAVTPVVTGEVNYQALDGLIRLCADLAALDDPGSTAPAGAQPGEHDGGPDGARPAEYDGHAAGARPGQHDRCPDGARPGGDGESPDILRRAPGLARSREALLQAVIGKAVDLLSGPGGLASYLRTRQLGGRLAGPSLPLDVGVSRDIPAGVRQAVLLRAGGRCEWPGGCGQPAAACQVHHTRHQADGGPTSARMCVLLCFFHHQVCIHRHGWTVTLNPDGTTTARSPDKKKILHSHGPPDARAG